MQLEIQKITGYAYGAIQPQLFLRFKDIKTQSSFWEYIKRIKDLLPHEENYGQFKFGSGVDTMAAPVELVSTLDVFNFYCGDLRLTPIKVFIEDEFLCFSIPTLSPDMAKYNLEFISKILMSPEDIFHKYNIGKEIEKQKDNMKLWLPAGTNAKRFIAAAAEQNIPFKIFSPQYVIFGYGSGSRIFCDSLTDQERVIGVRLAKSKVDTNTLLKMSGLPVAEQRRIRTYEDAARFAEKIGYPVVLKPEHEEQGRGVKTFITSEEELKAAYNSIEKKYPNLIIEKHYFGDGYRIHVLNNQVVRVRKQEPAKVYGDGVSDIKKLIKLENERRELDGFANAATKIIPDDTVISMLKKQNLDFDSIPSEFQEVILSPTSNTSRGGTSKDFLDKLHPENIEMCKQVAKTIGLYCSGIDLISTDASIPWYENGAIICEVNAQPQIGLAGKVEMHNRMIEEANISKTPISLHIYNREPEEGINIFNKSLNELKVSVSVKHVLQNGCPVQYFDTLEICEDISELALRRLNVMLESVHQSDV